MRAVLLNGSLEKGNKATDTEKLLHESAKIFKKENVDVDRIHLRDFQIDFGITNTLDGDDDWPFIFEKIKKADILLLATPVSMGDKSSIISLILERLQGYHRMENEKGQGLFYNKIGGTIVDGRGDGGAYAAAQSIVYRLCMLGFTLPPRASAICNETHVKATASEWECIEDDVRTMTYNLIHLAEIFLFHPIPVLNDTKKES
ncbi:flavodoxin family protein [Halobacillus fulvus]|nr:flavodoxin family protein [Halobacillus fulvus]